MKVALLITLLLPGLGSAQPPEDPVYLVNPLVGTQRSSLNDYGKTVPGATRPFGMLFWSPDMVTSEFYRYDQPETRGFSLTHISGPGCGQFGDVPIFPMLGLPGQSPVVRSIPNPYTARFSHSDEVAQPGYYAVKLDSGIGVRLAAQVRAGIAEFQFPAGAQPHTLLVDLSRNVSPAVLHTEVNVRERTITGSVTSGQDCHFLENQYKVYFALETDQAPQKWGTFDDLQVDAGDRSISGPRTGAYLSFPAEVTTVHLKVGLSYVSSANALANLRSEVPGWELDKVRQDARVAWNDALGHIQVKGGREEDRKVFYTALYHSLLHPSVFNDVNGDYIGFDSKVRKVAGRTQYANFSGWDIYRSQVQLIAMLFPKIGSDMAQSLVVDAEQGAGCRSGPRPTTTPAPWWATRRIAFWRVCTRSARKSSIQKQRWPQCCAARTIPRRTHGFTLSVRTWRSISGWDMWRNAACQDAARHRWRWNTRARISRFHASRMRLGNPPLHRRF